jgi:hypothetical protein
VPKRSADADTNFAYYFRESLSVLTTAFLLASVDKDRRILLFDPPVRIPRKHGADPLYLSITQTYRVVEADDGTLKANSTSYSYGLLAKQNDELNTLLEFHWHPEGTPNLKWPHLHVIANTKDGELNRVHFPTARLCIEDFIRLLIRDFDVKARLPYDEYKHILAKNKAAFVEKSSWLCWKPLI